MRRLVGTLRLVDVPAVGDEARDEAERRVAGLKPLRSEAGQREVAFDDLGVALTRALASETA